MVGMHFKFHQYSPIHQCEGRKGQMHGTWLLCDLPKDLIPSSLSVAVVGPICGKTDFVEGTLAYRPENSAIVELRAALQWWHPLALTPICPSVFLSPHRNGWRRQGEYPAMTHTIARYHASTNLSFDLQISNLEKIIT